MVNKPGIPLKKVALPAIVLLVAVSLCTAQQQALLLLNGQSTNVPVIFVSDHPYVGLEALAKVLNGSLSTAQSPTGSVVALSVATGSSGGGLVAGASSAAAPRAASGSATSGGGAAAPASSGLSRGFLNAGIEEASALREWHSALQSTIQSGFPLSAAVVDPYRVEASKSLRLASVAATSSDDRSAYQLLERLHQNMTKLSDKYVNMRVKMDYIAPDALQDDELNQRIVGCGRFLSSMAASGQFSDDGSCQ
ncbi:MAG TPA: hypothetical protein VMJ35_04305 [Dongiaceae bacterium]|nr:hypothetical protein [Dongiaceae bacterium]